MTKHFTDFEQLPVQERIFLMASVTAKDDESAREAMADEVAYHLRESARADEEAAKIWQLHDFGDLTLSDAVGSGVMELERSLQHIHKIITGYPPIA
jgi:hypothetical protein